MEFKIDTSGVSVEVNLVALAKKGLEKLLGKRWGDLKGTMRKGNNWAIAISECSDIYPLIGPKHKRLTIVAIAKKPKGKCQKHTFGPVTSKNWGDNYAALYPAVNAWIAAVTGHNPRLS